MADSRLLELQQRYKTALYGFLRITNTTEAHALFDKDPSQAPVFGYRSSVTEATIAARLQDIRADIAATPTNDEVACNFLQHRLLETKILELFSAMHDGRLPISPDNLERYRQLQIDLYGEISAELYSGVVQHLESFGHQSVATDMPLQPVDPGALTKLPYPTPELFVHYRQLAKSAFPELFAALESITDDALRNPEAVRQAFEVALQAVGAVERGWQVRTTPYGSNVMVSKHRQTIMVSEHWRPKSLFRLRQVIIHEVGGHVQRSMWQTTTEAENAFTEDEEGLAIMLEQLLASRFMFKRAIRYLAVCAAAGVDGIPRDFKQTYTILITALTALGNEPVLAGQSAFREAVRVFRGGFPATPGAIYIKDKVYLESNVRVWQMLEKHQMNAEEFTELFRGYATIAKTSNKQGSGL